ncbi:MAG: hypothetical protein MMC33_000132 [Icmadophila ericetorum]|nr:hypothetical protein [Icmadophila ericetorum]
MSDQGSRKRRPSISSCRSSIKRNFLKIFCRPTEAFSTLNLQQTITSRQDLLPSISRLSVLPDFTSCQYRFQTPEPVTPFPRSYATAGADAPLIRYSLESLRKSRDSLRSPAQTSRPDIYESDLTRKDPVHVRRRLSQLFANSPVRDPNRSAGYYELKSQALAHLILNGDGPQFFDDINRKAKSLFESFCIQDLQLPRHPISLTSVDLLPPEGHQIEGLWYLDDAEVADEVWQISTIEWPLGKTIFLVMKEDLIDRRTQRASHRFTSQVDITAIVGDVDSSSPLDHQDKTNASYDTEDDEDEDVWLTIAHEDIRKQASPKKPAHQSSTKPERSNGKAASSKLEAELEVTIHCIWLLHKYFFVVAGAVEGRWNFDITHVSRDLIDKIPAKIMTLHDAFPNSAAQILQQFLRERAFVLRLEGKNRESDQTLCGVPLFGPSLKCWLCFIIGRLPF